MARRAGSAVVFVLILTVVLSIIVTVAIKSGSLLEPLGSERIAYYKKQIALEALGNYAIARCWQQRNEPDKQEEKEVIYSVWPPKAGGFQAKITTSFSENIWFVVGKLFAKERLVGRVEARVAESKGGWQVLSWNATTTDLQ